MRTLLCLASIALLAGLTLAGCIRGSNSEEELDKFKRPKPDSAYPAYASAASAPAAPAAAAPAAKPTDDDGLPTGSGWFKPRTTWAGQRIDVSNTDPMVLPIYRLTIHHSGKADDATGDAEDHLRDFERVHKQKGWACIGYHFIISRDGTVYEGRPLKFQGAHATGDNNISNIGVCLMGDFSTRPVPATQRKSLDRVVERLRAQYRIKRSDIYGHRDFKGTDCPGEYLYRIVEQYRGN